MSSDTRPEYEQVRQPDANCPHQPIRSASRSRMRGKNLAYDFAVGLEGNPETSLQPQNYNEHGGHKRPSNSITTVQYNTSNHHWQRLAEEEEEESCIPIDLCSLRPPLSQTDALSCLRDTPSSLSQPPTTRY